MPYDPTAKLRPSLIGGGMGGYEEDFFEPEAAPQLPNLIEFLKGNNSINFPKPDDTYDPLQMGIGPAGTYAPPAGTKAAVVAPVQVADASSGPAVAGPPVASMADYIKMVKELMGSRSAANPAQDRADQYAERERERTRLLAQLAFSAGVTSSAGGSWQEVGQGFVNAGNVYDQGFTRYQAALQKSADRFQKTSDQSYDDNLAATSAGLDLYTAGAERDRKTWDDRLAGIDKMFGQEVEAAQSDLGADPAHIAKVMKRWQLSRMAGEYVPEDAFDVMQKQV